MPRRPESPRRTWPCPGLARDQQKGFCLQLPTVPGAKTWGAEAASPGDAVSESSGCGAGTACRTSGGRGGGTGTQRATPQPSPVQVDLRWQLGCQGRAAEKSQRNPTNGFFFFLQDFARLVKKPGKIKVYMSITCRQREILCKCFKPTLKVLS